MIIFGALEKLRFITEKNYSARRVHERDNELLFSPRDYFRKEGVQLLEGQVAQKLFPAAPTVREFRKEGNAIGVRYEWVSSQQRGFIMKLYISTDYTRFPTKELVRSRIHLRKGGSSGRLLGRKHLYPHIWFLSHVVRPREKEERSEKEIREGLGEP